MEQELKGFTVRVYGFLENESQEILMLTENIGGKPFCKFPGGGVELGEGITEALIRELKEELNLEVMVQEHLYTTDFFIRSAFYPQYQVLAIYYAVKCVAMERLQVLDSEIISLNWIKKESASLDLISLETDRIAFAKLL